MGSGALATVELEAGAFQPTADPGFGAPARVIASYMAAALQEAASMAHLEAVLAEVATLVVEVREAVGNTDRWLKLWLRL